MIISHKFKFIFIEIPKTGTTSIVNYFFTNLKVNDDFLFFRKLIPPSRCWRHCTIQDTLQDFSQCSDYFKFAFVRNPWDRCVSYYCWEKDVYKKEITFEEYIQMKKYDLLQKQYIGNNLDFIGRFENLHQDFDIICNKIGIPRQQLLHENKTNHKHYTKYYNEKTRDLAVKKYKEDIDFFGYKFGE